MPNTTTAITGHFPAPTQQLATDHAELVAAARRVIELWKWGELIPNDCGQEADVNEAMFALIEETKLEIATQASIKLATTARAILRESCPAKSKEAFLFGAQTARNMLKTIQKKVKQQVEDEGDFSISSIAGLIHAYLPAPGGREVVGFSAVLAEYLASCADGMVLSCDFEPSCLVAFLCGDESGVEK